MYYTIVIAVLCCLCIFKIWWSQRRYRQLGNMFPGLPTFPLLGNIPQIIGEPNAVYSKMCQAWVKSGKRNFRFWIGPVLGIFLTVAEDVEELFVNKRLLDRDPYMMRILSRFVGNGLITCTSKTWRKQRKIISPVLQGKALEAYLEVFNKESLILVEKLNKLADGNVFDLGNILLDRTASMVAENTIGTSINTENYTEGFIGQMLTRMNRLVFERFIRPWLIFDFLYDLTAMGKEQKIGEQILSDWGDKCIMEKVEEYRNFKSNASITEEWIRDGNSIIDYIIESSEAERGELDEQLLRDEVHTIFISGTDSAAKTLSYVLMMLANHPKVQDDVNEELSQIFYDDWERDVTTDDVRQMKYLDRVIKETMRLFPAVPIIPRVVPEEAKLRDHTLPAGCMCSIVVPLVHRDPRNWPDPDRFDPDRFLPERSKDRHPFSYIPFGAGPRMCVGFKYAELVLRVMLATVLKRYQVLPAVSYEETQELEIGLTLKPHCGFMIRMLPRTETAND